jgi:preprotein translocase subunit SecF
MTKTKFNPTNKLPAWLAIWIVVILAGLALLVVFAVQGTPIFKPADSMTDHKEFTVYYDLGVEMNDDSKEQVEGICNDALGSIVMKYDVNVADEGGSITYWVTSDTSDETLVAAWNKIEQALQNDGELSYNQYSYEIVSAYMQPTYSYIWRAAIAGGVLIVIATLYILIRFSVPMGLATLIAGVGDVLVVLALTIIGRIPTTSVLAVMAVFAVLYSVLMSLISFSSMRKTLKSEECAELDIRESMILATNGTVKNVLILTVSVIVIGAALAVFGGEAVRAAAFGIILSAVASAYSTLCVKPALVTAFKLQGKKMKDEKIEKQRLAKIEEDRMKADKRASSKE